MQTKGELRILKNLNQRCKDNSKVWRGKSKKTSGAKNTRGDNKREGGNAVSKPTSSAADDIDEMEVEIEPQESSKKVKGFGGAGKSTGNISSTKMVKNLLSHDDDENMEIDDKMHTSIDVEVASTVADFSSEGSTEYEDDVMR